MDSETGTNETSVKPTRDQLAARAEKYSKEQLARVIVDLLDGQSRWHDIRDATGVPLARCHEISVVYSFLMGEIR